MASIPEISVSQPKSQCEEIMISCRRNEEIGGVVAGYAAYYF